MAKKTQSLERIYDNPRYAAESARLQMFEEGQREAERAIAVLNLESYLGNTKPTNPAEQSQLRRQMQERLERLRAGAPQKNKSESAPGDGMPPEIVAALELLQARLETQDSKRSPRFDRRAEIVRLEDDRDVFRKAIFAQQLIVDEIRGELEYQIHTAALQLVKPEHNEDVLAQYRAAQQFAAATDRIRARQKSVTDAGYRWRSDLLPTPGERLALMLGSEADYNSGISCMRRMMEELKIIL